MNPQALDRFLTTEPDNGCLAFIERIWSTIPEEEISGDEYDKYEDLFSFWENKLSTSGVRTRRNSTGFPAFSFCVEVIKRRYRYLKTLLKDGWTMEEPNLFVNPIDGKKYKIEIAFEIAYDYKHPYPRK